LFEKNIFSDIKDVEVVIFLIIKLRLFFAWLLFWRIFMELSTGLVGHSFFMQPIIRQANFNDCLSIMSLMSQLGYPMTNEELLQRMKIYLNANDSQIFVAEQENIIVGVVAITSWHAFVGAKKVCRVSALVIDEKYRGFGIGRSLMAATEDYARKQECLFIELTSALHRAKDGAHDFYKKLGYGNSGVIGKLYLRKDL